MELLKMINWTKIVYVLFGVVFLTSGVLINILQLVLYIFLNPFNQRIYRKINYYLCYSIFSQLVFTLQYWANVNVTLHVKKSDYDKYFGKEKALLILNHTYEIDWLIGWILCENCNVLGNCKTFAKKSLQYIPTFGYALKMGGSIFLERIWDKDRKVLGSKLEELVNYEYPFWLLLTAEGTRFTKEKHEASKAFAKEQGLPELRYHLTPRTKGFTTALPYMRHKIPALYNISVGVNPDGESASIGNILLGKTIAAELFVERIPIDSIPEEEEKMATWLHNLYKRKDDLLHSFLKTGNWFEISNVEARESFLLPRRIFPLVNFSCWCFAILVPLAYFLVKVMISGNFGSCIAVLATVALVTFILDRIVAEAKISKASSYGATNVGGCQVKN